MQSLNLLSSIEAIPLSREHRRYGMADVVTRSSEMRSEVFAIETGVALERATRHIFETRNVPDDLFEAFRQASPSVAGEQGLYERYLEMADRGPESVTGFVNNVKGKLFEVRLPDHLESEFPGYTFRIGELQNQPGWDIVATAPDGSDVFIQAKMGGAGYARDVLERMQSDPDTIFAVSHEIRDEILASHPELASQFVNVDISNLEFTSDVTENMRILAENFGLDVPDEIGEMLPYVSEVILGLRLLVDIVNTERDFKYISLDDRARVNGMKALVLIQRFGVSTVCVSAASAGAGAVLPGLGHLGGAAGGAYLASKLNKKLRPRTMEIAMGLVRVTDDDIYYFKNKLPIDEIGSSLEQSAHAVTVYRGEHLSRTTVTV